MWTWPRVPESPHYASGTRTGLTEGDFALVEARFDALPPGSAWCGYGTCNLDGQHRLAIFLNTGGQRVMTLTRFSDETYEIVDEDGTIRIESLLEDFLAGLARLRLFDG